MRRAKMESKHYSLGATCQFLHA